MPYYCKKPVALEVRQYTGTTFWNSRTGATIT